MCGVVGAIRKDGTYSTGTSKLLHSLLSGVENRGQESSGLALQVSTNKITVRKRPGTPNEGIHMGFLDQHPSNKGVGQTRYSTQGKGVSLKNKEAQNFIIDSDYIFDINNAQPFVARDNNEQEIVLVTNGNITNTHYLRRFLKNVGYKSTCGTDSETFLILIKYFITNPQKQKALIKEAKTQNDKIANAIFNAMKMLKGSGSTIVMYQNALFVCRDVHENRPLKIAQTAKHYIVASESTAWHECEGEFLKDVPAGSITCITKDGLTFYPTPFKICLQKCSLEKVYMNHPTSALTSVANNVLGYEKVGDFRDFVGGEIYKFVKDNLGPGIIVQVEESGEYYALGTSFEHSQDYPGLSFTAHAYKKTKRALRNFIYSQQLDREQKIRLKFANMSLTLQKRIRYILKHSANCWIILTDDTLIRSTTATDYIARLRKNLKDMLTDDEYAKIKIALLLGAPRIVNPCFYGIDMPTKKELAASTLNNNQIAQKIGADFVGFPTLKLFMSFQGKNSRDYCYACFEGGKYIIPITSIQRNTLL